MRQYVGHEIIEQFAVPSEEHPEAIMLSEERKQLLDELFKLDNPECQKLVHLYFREQVKYKDIVKHHGKELKLENGHRGANPYAELHAKPVPVNLPDKRFMAFVADEFEDMSIRELFRSNADHLNKAEGKGEACQC